MDIRWNMVNPEKYVYIYVWWMGRLEWDPEDLGIWGVRSVAHEQGYHKAKHKVAITVSATRWSPRSWGVRYDTSNVQRKKCYDMRT